MNNNWIGFDADPIAMSDPLKPVKPLWT